MPGVRQRSAPSWQQSDLPGNGGGAHATAIESSIPNVLTVEMMKIIYTSIRSGRGADEG